MKGELERPRKTAGPEVDLNDLLRQGQFDISIKSTETEPDGRVRRFKEQLTFVLAIGMVGLVFVACLGVLLFGHPSDEEQRWVQSALTLILGAAVGAAFKK